MKISETFVKVHVLQNRELLNWNEDLEFSVFGNLLWWYSSHEWTTGAVKKENELQKKNDSHTWHLSSDEIMFWFIVFHRAFDAEGGKLEIIGFKKEKEFPSVMITMKSLNWYANAMCFRKIYITF